MSKTSVLLAALASLSVAACSAPSETEEHAGMDHGDMHHAEAGDTGALQPLADDGVTPVIDVRAAWMRPHPGGRDVTAAYFTVRLGEGSIDRLLGARIDGAERVELHGHTMSADGMMQMRPIGAQEVNADGPLVFTPGGHHLMVFGLATVVEGEQATGTLVFERAGEVPVTFEVRNMPPGMPSEN